MPSEQELALAAAEAWVHARMLILVQNGTPASEAKSKAMREFDARFPSFGITWV